jgi:hypothetical protein
MTKVIKYDMMSGVSGFCWLINKILLDIQEIPNEKIKIILSNVPPYTSARMIVSQLLRQNYDLILDSNPKEDKLMILICLRKEPGDKIPKADH